MSQDPIARVVRREICTEADMRRVAAMLDMAPEPVLATGLLPHGWQFLLIRSDPSRSSIRPDGFAGLGIALPASTHSRVVLAGREVRFFDAIPIETALERTSEIADIANKNTEGGPITRVTISHQIRHAHSTEILLEEKQTYILMDDQYSEATGRETHTLAGCASSTTLTPTELILFQYSALCFNSHRIHYDRLYATTIEGYPDLVVNGGLIALLATEYLRNTLAITPIGLKARHRAPLFADRPFTIAVQPQSQTLSLHIINEGGQKAADIEIAL